jgi:hypothetical protein
MGPRERARLTDGNANSIGAEKKCATAKPKPWESNPYNYEGQTNAGSSSLCNPRLDYVEQFHAPHPDDSTPYDNDGDHGYGSSVFGVTPLLDASASTANDQGTLAGCFGRPKTKTTSQQSDNQFWTQQFHDHDHELNRAYEEKQLSTSQAARQSAQNLKSWKKRTK